MNAFEEHSDDGSPILNLDHTFQWELETDGLYDEAIALYWIIISAYIIMWHGDGSIWTIEILIDDIFGNL